MSLREKIKEDLKESLKAKDAFKLSVLRMLQASILNKEKDKRTKTVKADPDRTEEEIAKASALTDEEVIEAVLSEVKKRKDSVEQYEKGNRSDLAEQEKKELAVLMTYAPEQMPEGEIRKIVQEAIKKTGATEPKDSGQVMGTAMPQLKGKADGSLVSKIVQEELKKQGE